MGRTYEYCTVKNGEDITINLTVISFSRQEGKFSSQAADPDEYYGSVEIDWKSDEDTSYMSADNIASMEEWLVNEHSEYLDEQAYCD